MVERVFYVFLFLYTALNKNLPSKLKSLSAFHDIWGPGKVYQPEGAELKEVAVQWNMNTDQARVFAKSIGDIQDGLAKYSKILADKPITKRFGRETHEMIVYDDKIHKAESDLLSIKATLSHVATGLPRTNLNDVLIKIRTSDVVKSIKSDLKSRCDPHTRLVLMGNILPKGENPRRVTFPNLPMQEIGLKSNAETLNRLRNLEKATLELLKEERENDIVAAEYLSWLKAIPDKNLQKIKSEMKQYTAWTRSLNVDVTPNPATNPVEGRATNPATNPVTQTKPVTDPSTSNPTK
ncbi:hypothetical protein BY996DRAFT_7235440 [Phakopsora pachyrhizi]|nr:hypothetical protein BY996DRAFT_7235440 [Phakopsora pachyrhizi]